MSKLVDEYLELSRKAFDGAKDEKDIGDVRDEMAKLKEKFDEGDWDDLIARVPNHIKPMVKAQKEKYLK